MPVPSHRLIYLATLRTVHRSALYPRQAAQPLYLLHFADLHTGDGFGCDGVDRGAIGNEWLPEGNSRTHVGGVAASGSGC